MAGSAPSPADLRRLALERASAEGFDAAGVADLDRLDPAIGERLAAFLAAHHHGTMDWLAQRATERSHPRRLWREARSAVMLGMSYGPDDDPLARLGERSRGIVSAYAKRRDYHDVVKSGLKRVARALADVSGSDVKVFVDTAPLMEKPIAAAAGLGWQGKHTNLVSRSFGSWLFLGAILTAAEIEADRPEIDHCGSCRRCLDVCPTDAFPAPYRLDARRCIAYLTIEHDGPIDPALRTAIGNRVFGCDDCLAICPWNKFASAARDLRLSTLTALDDPPLAELLALDDATFRTLFSRTPVKRSGRERIVRNALIAAGNSGDRKLCEPVLALLRDPAPTIRGAAVWALSQLLSPDELRSIAICVSAGESDAYVSLEWEQALARA